MSVSLSLSVCFLLRWDPLWPSASCRRGRTGAIIAITIAIVIAITIAIVIAITIAIAIAITIAIVIAITRELCRYAFVGKLIVRHKSTQVSC